MYKQADLLNQALAGLEESTGLSARVVKRKLASAADTGVDAWVQIQGPSGTHEFAAEVKAVDRFETPAAVKSRLGSVARPLLVAPAISPAVADRCRKLELSFLDMAGNAHLTAPGLFVFVTGRKLAARGGKRAFRAQTETGLKVVFALLCRPDLAEAPYREIARAAGTSSGAITQVIRDLRDRGLLSRSKPRRLLAPEKLLDEWVTFYASRLRPKLVRQRFTGDPDRLIEADIGQLGGQWSGDIAGARLTGYLKPATFEIYTDQRLAKIVAGLRLQSNPAGNTEILERFWNFDSGPDACCVPPILAYADLLASGDGRSAETAKLIYERYIESALAARP